MIARLISISLLLVPLLCTSQSIFKSGEKYGLEFEGETIYNADYDEIYFKDYFIYGKKGKYFYILSEEKANSKKGYKRFLFHLTSELLVVGITDENKLDILSEDGGHYYLKDGNYDRVESIENHTDSPDPDLLLVSKSGKIGIYNWVKKTEFIPPNYDRLKLHDGCDESGRLTYAGKGSENTLWSENNGLLFSFNSRLIDDIYPATVCEGYILKFGLKIGYIREKKNGKLFLIKPIYEDLYFPTNDPNIIMLKTFDQYGLYYNNRMILKCKYSSIEVIDGNYIFAVAVKYQKLLDIEKTYNINKEGKVIAD